MKTNLSAISLLLLLLVTISAPGANAILETFVNYIYWGPPGYTARVGFCPGNDVEQALGGGFYVTLHSAHDCAQMCNLRQNETSSDDSPTCVGFSFSPTTKRCYLKSKSCGSTVMSSSNDTTMMFDLYNGTGCPVGFYGWNCSYYCSCAHNEVCNPIDGSCPRGCSEHHWGWGCSLINTCFYDDEGGAHYKGNRYNTISGANCQPWHDRHPHDHNFTDVDMPDGSLQKARNYCRNPKRQTADNSNDTSPVLPGMSEPWCFVLDKPDEERETCYVKKCSCEFGRYGTNCELECPEGRYGQDCRFECQCDADETCSKLTGKCQKCPPGYFGSGCLRRCHCRDASEVCNYRSGSCSVCHEGFGGVDCYTRLPFLSKQPWVKKRSPTSLALAWENWFQCHAKAGCGEGPISGFFVEYHPKNSQITKWKQTFVSANTTEIEFNNLHDDVIYELRVTPIHANWLQGIASTPVEFQICGDSKVAPHDVEVVHRNCNEHFCDAEVSFSKISNLTDLNCDASKVTYMVSYAQLTADNVEPSTYSSVTCTGDFSEEPRCRLALGRLTPGSFFTVKVCASSAKSVPVFWKRLSETMIDKKCGPVFTTTFRTPHGEPTAPLNLSLTNIAPKRAFIEWQPPALANAPLSAVFYSVEMREIRVRACGKRSESEAVSFFTNGTSAHLEPLKPWTQYSVSVYAHNPDHKSKQGAWLQFVTHPDTPEARLSARITKVASDFVQVAVDEPPCNLIHGDMAGFHYEISLMNPRNGSTLISGHSNESSFRVPYLEPFSNYLMVVNLVNNKGQGGPSVPIKFKTEEAKPAEPRRLEVVNISASSLQMSVAMPPNPCANIRFMEIKLIDLEQEFQAAKVANKNNGGLPKKDGVKEEKKDVIRVGANNHGTISLTSLRPNTKYRVQVRAVADSGVSEWTEPIIVRTRKDNHVTSLEDALAAVYDDSNYLDSMPLIAGVIASILFVVLIFSGVAAGVLMWRRRITRSMIPAASSSLSRSCTSGGTSSPSSSTAADDVQGRWRTIPHFLQEMKGESMMYTTAEVIGLCDSPPTTFMPQNSSGQPVRHPSGAIIVSTDSSCSSGSSPPSASPDSNSSGGMISAGGGLLKKVVPAAPQPPPRPPTAPRPTVIIAQRPSSRQQQNQAQSSQSNNSNSRRNF